MWGLAVEDKEEGRTFWLTALGSAATRKSLALNFDSKERAQHEADIQNKVTWWKLKDYTWEPRKI